LSKFQILSDGRNVWVNSVMGASLARYSTRAGIDIHHPPKAVAETGDECLFCIHDGTHTFELFVEKMLELYGVVVPADALEQGSKGMREIR
jgi:hypothetical protein